MPWPRRIGPKNLISSTWARIAPEIEEAIAPRLDRQEHRDQQPTSASGSGDAVALLKVTESAMPVATTAQLVVASSRVRQTVLR